MLDFSSLQALAESLPEVPPELQDVLMMRSRRSDELSPATASLASRGYIGCFPFAHIRGDEIVLRLLPGRPLKNTRVAVAWGDFIEGLTISPDLERFIACRLAQLDASTSPVPLTDALQRRLLQFAAEFGSTESTERVIAALPRARLLEKSQERSSVLWGAACPDESLCQVLAGAWSRSGDELSAWVDSALARFPDEDIVWRLYVAHHVTNNTGTDVTDIAWKIVLADTLFDPTYEGVLLGPSLNNWSSSPLVLSAQWLEQRGSKGVDRRRALSLEAARAFARERDEYSGVEHLEAARALATEDPVLAYTHAVNAGAFFVRATGLTPAASIVLCHELAKAHGWGALLQVLEWTLNELSGD